ncbi:hypothetical protein AVEN_200747-1 [Araneus ventricosus]|uniref:Uncharacterized protein n=1 Tax=Araneus ventricosus TaxID=182803 RepID=A0A4Y2P0P1_ARAVE|nr:hypothetical protein AVEN_200747-1 [Araneus ventricosus]
MRKLLSPFRCISFNGQLSSMKINSSRISSPAGYFGLFLECFHSEECICVGLRSPVGSFGASENEENNGLPFVEDDAENETTHWYSFDRPNLFNLLLFTFTIYYRSLSIFSEVMTHSYEDQ